MDQSVNEIRLAYIDPGINDLLAGIPADTARPLFKKKFNQNEEFFLSLPEEFYVPHFPIHHDVRADVPRADYIASMRDLVAQLVVALPAEFEGLSYFFDPAEVLKPCFYRIYRVQDSLFLYLMRVDLLFRASHGEVVQPGTNDLTPVYRSRNLFLESDLIPIDAVMAEMGRTKGFKVRQTISQTWIGETGQGYMVRGIWMDSELTKFFSKLFLPAGKRTYPFYPFSCKYKTVCMTVAEPDAETRKRLLPFLHRAVEFLVPEMETIQNALKGRTFAEDIGEFREIKARVPALWDDFMKNLAIAPYLNENGLKEYDIEF
jgi:hypothetical protein